MARSFEEEGWFEIPDFPPYEMDQDGNVRNGSTMRILKGSVVWPSGYKQVTLRRDGQNHGTYIHLLTASMFKPKPPGKHRLVHLNANRYDNRVENLEWKPI